MKSFNVFLLPGERPRKQQVERTRYEADLAQQRYMKVDPNNRLVADALEADWNDKIRSVTKAQEEYERQRQADRTLVDEESKEQILSLATDFHKLWRDPKTPNRERKRMVRLLIEDVTLTKADQIKVQIRFKGGASKTLTLQKPQTAWELRMTDSDVVAEVDRLINDYTDAQIARQLNQRGLRSGEGLPFDSRSGQRIRRAYTLKSRYERLREAGKLNVQEMAEQLGVSTSTVKIWRKHGLLRGYAYNDKNCCLFEPSDGNCPVKSQGQKLSERRRFLEVLTNQPNKVQHAT